MQHPMQRCTLLWQHACRKIFPVFAPRQRSKGVNPNTRRIVWRGIINQMAKLGRVLPKLVRICYPSATIRHSLSHPRTPGLQGGSGGGSEWGAWFGYPPGRFESCPLIRTGRKISSIPTSLGFQQSSGLQGLPFGSFLVIATGGTDPSPKDKAAASK